MVHDIHELDQTLSTLFTAGLGLGKEVGLCRPFSLPGVLSVLLNLASSFSAIYTTVSCAITTHQHIRLCITGIEGGKVVDNFCAKSGTIDYLESSDCLWFCYLFPPRFLIA